MPSTPVQATSRAISNRLTKLENSLKQKLLSFYNKNIKGKTTTPIEVLRTQYDGQIRNIIRKAAQDSYLVGTDTIGQQLQEKNPDFDLFISGTDLNNISQLTNDLSDQFWGTASRLHARESSINIENGEVVPVKPFDVAAAITGVAAAVAFGSFNTAIQSKTPIATEAASIDLELGITIQPLTGRVRFTTQQDSKVDAQICDPLDGTEWDANDPDIVVPPQDTHPNCRCQLIPIIE
jgi:hypothetical protein